MQLAMKKKYNFKLTLSFLVIIMPVLVFSQKTSRDLLVLKNGNTQAGKVIQSDSFSLLLKKYDHSMQKYNWSEIDSVRGLSYKTVYFSAGLGLSQVNFWSTLLYKNVKTTSAAFNYRIGTLKWRHWSRYAELVFLSTSPFKIQRLGVGGSYYIPFGYTYKLNFYGGINANFTFVENNRNYFSTGLHLGTEYLHKNRYRLFAEMDFQRAIFNINQNTSFCLLAGFRTGKEFGLYYKKLNTTHKLP